MPAHPPPGLRGRVSELELLDRLLGNVRGGQSAVLVVRGDAGAGKTALLRHAAGRATDFRIAQIAGVESEMELPFAGLHQLCRPMLGRLDALPGPQRTALQIAFGLASGDPPDRFLVALAALSLLAETAEEQPLVCLVDDAQWLDRASAQVLGFVARRLLAESVAIVFAARAPDDTRELAGLPELTLGGLAQDDARALLATVIPGPIDEGVRNRIVAETRGNPLALLELPRGLTAAQLAGGFGLPDVLPLSGRIEESFLRRLEALPDDARMLLLVAAAEPVGDPSLLLRAADLLGLGDAMLEPAERAGLLDVGALVRFRHPLVRSAVYRSASGHERRRAHEVLAEVTDARLEPDRRAWHRAQAASGPDEAIAVELERSAGRAQARGGLSAAAAFLGRAAGLTPDPARRGERTLRAAQVSVEAGSFDAALALLAAVEAAPLDDLGRARVDLLHAEVAYSQNRGSDAPPLLLRAAQRLEPLDARLARDTYLDAWGAALFAGPLAGRGSLREVSLAAMAGPPAPVPPRACDLLLDGLALLFAEGRAAAAPVLERATTAFAGDEASVEEVLRWGWLATAGAAAVWDIGACRAVASREVQLARDAGALAVLAVGVNVLGQVVALGGDFAKVASLVAEADVVTVATGARVAPYAALVLAALRGHEADAAVLVDATIRDGTAGGQGTAVQYAHWAAAVVANAAGRYGDALESATRASADTPELFASAWALAELVEAAARSGRPDLAAGALARLAGHVGAGDADWGRAIEARSRALLSEGEDAEEGYREAIQAAARASLGPDLGRAHLLYGEWLRREHRRVDAREQLRTAHELLAGMGADGFAERARRELVATGETVRKRRDDTRDELTPQEAHIAALAREGRTNAEIGAQLFLSPRTVEWHLRKVFAKLGISSRMGLHDALESATPAS